MNKWATVVAIAAVVVAFGSGRLAARQQANPHVEYLCDKEDGGVTLKPNVPKALTDKLNAKAAEGWTLASMTASSTGLILYCMQRTR